MARYGNIEIKQVVDLSNFTATGGNNLYFKIDGNIGVTNPDNTRHNVEFRTIEGGIRWNYTNNYGWQPYALLNTYGANYYLNYLLSNTYSSGLTRVSYDIEYSENNGSIALYVDGVLSGSAEDIPTLNSLIQRVYISIDPSLTTGELIIDTNIPMITLVDDGTEEFENIWRSYGIPEGAYENYGYAPADIVEHITVNYLTGYIEDDTIQYYIYNTYASGKGTFDGFTKTGSNIVRNENIYAQAGHNLALYYTTSDNSLRLRYNQSVIRQVYYSNGQQFIDSGTNVEYTFFYNYWQGRLGDTISASRFDTNIPIFETMAMADGYLTGNVDISQAINFDELSGGINPTNKTALKDIATEFSDTYHTGVFGIQLACTISALREIANAIYSQIPDVIEDIKKGLEMFGTNPIDSIIDLSYYPFDVAQVVTGSIPQNYVNFGSYRCELLHNVNRIVYSNGYIDCGSVNFLPTYNNYMDYTHVGLEVYLPYIGMKQLDTNLYMGHQISVRYYIDFHTRGCTACILSDGLLCDYFEGQIGISQPITATNYSDYARTTIQTLVSSGSSVVGSGANVVGSYLGGNAMGMIGGAASGLANVGATVYDVSTNNAAHFANTKGNVGADTGGHMPQYVFFRFTYERPIEPTNLLQLYGKPSNKGGRISSFGGFLKCSTVELECGRATDSEKNAIISLLKSGIRI